MKQNYLSHLKTVARLSLRVLRIQTLSEVSNSVDWSSTKSPQSVTGIGYGQRYFVLPSLIIPLLRFLFRPLKGITTSMTFTTTAKNPTMNTSHGDLQVTTTHISLRKK